MDKQYQLPSVLSNAFNGAELPYCRGCYSFTAGKSFQLCIGRCGAFWHTQCLHNELKRIEKRDITSSFIDTNFRRIARNQSLCPTCGRSKKCNNCETEAKAHLIQCYKCSRAFHEKCLGQPISSDWPGVWICEFCSNNKKCNTCGTRGNAHLFQCSTCNRAFHEKCLSQPFCYHWSEAGSCTKCHSSNAEIKNQSKIQRILYHWPEAWQCEICKLANVTTDVDPFNIPNDFFVSLRQHRELRQDEESNQYLPSVVEFGKWEIKTEFSSGKKHSSAYSREFRIPKIYICEFCLNIETSRETIKSHYHNCQSRLPPGNEIYRDSCLSVFEVDGEISPTYCIELCLLAKCWLMEKNLYTEVEAFLFYVLTYMDAKGHHLLGFFSKEKRWHENNLASILVLPPYQKQGYGLFLIEFSYLLSRKEGRYGRPESPLSEHGQGVYTTYWKSAILEFFSNHGSANTLTIKDISDATGIIDVDVANTLLALNILQPPAPPETLPTIVVDWSLVESHKKKRISRLKVLSDNLFWKPHQFSNKNESQMFIRNEDVELTLVFNPLANDTSVLDQPVPVSNQCCEKSTDKHYNMKADKKTTKMKNVRRKRKGKK